ncbi:MAG: hypothetical protein JXM68_07025 [Sedimentisphaerales bacterium]|nr:hypothetical protein [Sedimentisphaerales bacterium]
MSNQDCTSLGQIIFNTEKLVDGLELVRQALIMCGQPVQQINGLIDLANDLRANLEDHKAESLKEYQRYFNLGKQDRNMLRKAGHND